MNGLPEPNGFRSMFARDQERIHAMFSWIAQNAQRVAREDQARLQRILLGQNGERREEFIRRARGKT